MGPWTSCTDIGPSDGCRVDYRFILDIQDNYRCQDIIAN